MWIELLIGGLTALSTFIGATWAIVKYYDQKKTKEEKEQKQKESDRDRLLQTMSDNIVSVHKTSVEQHQEILDLKCEISHIKEQLAEVNQKIQDTQTTIDENEMDRLRSDIINCVDKIENGFAISEADLLHIHHDYDKYSAQGGNSYIESCMDFVRDYERECREAGLFDTPSHN